MKKTFVFATILFSFITNAQISPQETVEKVPSANLTFYEMPANLITTTGVTYSGMIKYKEYGKKILYFMKSSDADYSVIEKSGYDSIQKIVITNTNKSSTLGQTVTYAPVRLSPKSEYPSLYKVVELNDVYGEYSFFRVSENKFAISDDPAPANTVIPGVQLYYLINKRNGAVFKKGDLMSLPKKITQFIDYCPAVTDKVVNKEVGYKTTLMNREDDVLKKCYLEANEICPK